MQQGMLFHAIGEPGSGVDIEQIVCRLDEQLDTKPCARMGPDRFTPHDSATAFVWEGIAEPLQQVHDSVRFLLKSSIGAASTAADASFVLGSIAGPRSQTGV